jgi:hypothetical protein
VGYGAVLGAAALQATRWSESAERPSPGRVAAAILALHGGYAVGMLRELVGRA